MKAPRCRSRKVLLIATAKLSVPLSLLKSPGDSANVITLEKPEDDVMFEKEYVMLPSSLTIDTRLGMTEEALTVSSKVNMIVPTDMSKSNEERIGGLVSGINEDDCWALLVLISYTSLPA